MKYNFIVTELNQPSQKAIDAMNTYIKINIDNDTFIFDIKHDNGNIKEMRLNELIKYRQSQGVYPI